MIIEEIAASSGLSRAHFFKLFKENTGLSPNIYLNTLTCRRVAKANCEPETNNRYNFGEFRIFQPKSFSRFFTSHVGLAPGEYRQFAAI